MHRRYFDKNYEWLDETHQRHETRAYQMFHSGEITVGHSHRVITPRHIRAWLEKGLIREASPSCLSALAGRISEYNRRYRAKKRASSEVENG